MSNLNQNTTQLELLLAKVNALPEAGSGGTDTSDATATTNDILNGKTAYVNGEKITGTMPAVEQATPTITIDSTNGLITATATQDTGYVIGGTKNGTKQLAFQAAQIITPGTTNKTIAANTYVGGAQTIKGDSNLVAGNIKNGVTIFNVTGNYEGEGGSGDTSVEDSIITKTIFTYSNDRVSIIGDYAFYDCTNLTFVSFPACTHIGGYTFCNTNLTSVSFPACTNIGYYAFNNCINLGFVSFPKCTNIGNYAFNNTNLTSVNFPECTSIGRRAFKSCTNLTSVSFPNCTSIGSYAFCNCSSLTSVSFPNCTSIGSYAFQSCTNLTYIYLLASSICQLLASNAFFKTKITRTAGCIYVPLSLLTSYKAATNWTYFSNRIFGM